MSQLTYRFARKFLVHNLSAISSPIIFNAFISATPDIPLYPVCVGFMWNTSSFFLMPLILVLGTATTTCVHTTYWKGVSTLAPQIHHHPGLRSLTKVVNLNCSYRYHLILSLVLRAVSHQMSFTWFFSSYLHPLPPIRSLGLMLEVDLCG